MLVSVDDPLVHGAGLLAKANDASLGLGVLVHSLLNRLIDWYLAKGRSAGPLYAELAIKELLVHVWVLLLKRQHLTPVQCTIPCIVRPIVRDHSLKHASHADHVQVPVACSAGTKKLEQQIDHLDV